MSKIYINKKTINEYISTVRTHASMFYFFCHQRLRYHNDITGKGGVDLSTRDCAELPFQTRFVDELSYTNAVDAINKF